MIAEQNLHPNSTANQGGHLEAITPNPVSSNNLGGRENFFDKMAKVGDNEIPLSHSGKLGETIIKVDPSSNLKCKKIIIVREVPDPNLTSTVYHNEIEPKCLSLESTQHEEQRVDSEKVAKNTPVSSSFVSLFSTPPPPEPKTIGCNIVRTPGNSDQFTERPAREGMKSRSLSRELDAASSKPETVKLRRVTVSACDQQPQSQRRSQPIPSASFDCANPLPESLLTKRQRRITTATCGTSSTNSDLKENSDSSPTKKSPPYDLKYFDLAKDRLDNKKPLVRADTVKDLIKRFSETGAIFNGRTSEQNNTHSLKNLFPQAGPIEDTILKTDSIEPVASTKVSNLYSSNAKTDLPNRERQRKNTPHPRVKVALSPIRAKTSWAEAHSIDEQEEDEEEELTENALQEESNFECLHRVDQENYIRFDPDEVFTIACAMGMDDAMAVLLRHELVYFQEKKKQALRKRTV